MFYASGITVLDTEGIPSLSLLRLKLLYISYTDSHLKEWTALHTLVRHYPVIIILE